MYKKRITKKDIDALYEAIDFISSNSDGAGYKKYFNDLTKRITKIWKILKNKQNTD